MPEQMPLSIIEWQINARARIQQLLFKIFNFLSEHTEFHKADDEQWYPMMRMVYIGFSLWRSAFLTQAQRDRQRIHKDTIDFLGKLLNYNMITFADDYTLRGLTIGYYNANAKYRLERQYYFGSKEIKGLHSLEKIDKLHGAKDAESADQTLLWEDYFKALSDSFDEFMRDWHENVRPKRERRRGAALAAHAPPATPDGGAEMRFTELAKRRPDPLRGTDQRIVSRRRRRNEPPVA